jgi:hypothetical protein
MIPVWGIKINKKTGIANTFVFYNLFDIMQTGCCGRDRMVVVFITTYVISAFHH